MLRHRIEFNHGTAMRLSAFIIEHLDQIAAEWGRFAAPAQPAQEDATDAPLHDHSRDILQAIAQDVERAGSHEPANACSVETAAATHGALRHSAGFDLAQLTAEFRALRSCVLRLWGAERFGNEPDAFEQVMCFNDAIDQALAEAVQQPGGMVLSTGGGAVLRADNREILRAFGNVLYLRASPEEIFRRVKHDRTRPLLQGGNPLDKLRALYAQRDGLYRETAHYVIETGRPTVHTLINMIMMQLEMAAAGAQE